MVSPHSSEMVDNESDVVVKIFEDSMPREKQICKSTVVEIEMVDFAMKQDLPEEQIDQDVQQTTRSRFTVSPADQDGSLDRQTKGKIDSKQEAKNESTVNSICLPDHVTRILDNNEIKRKQELEDDDHSADSLDQVTEIMVNHEDGTTKRIFTVTSIPEEKFQADQAFQRRIEVAKMPWTLAYLFQTEEYMQEVRERARQALAYQQEWAPPRLTLEDVQIVRSTRDRDAISLASSSGASDYFTGRLGSLIRIRKSSLVFLGAIAMIIGIIFLIGFFKEEVNRFERSI